MTYDEDEAPVPKVCANHPGPCEFRRHSLIELKQFFPFEHFSTVLSAFLMASLHVTSPQCWKNHCSPFSLPVLRAAATDWRKHAFIKPGAEASWIPAAQIAIQK